MEKTFSFSGLKNTVIRTLQSKLFRFEKRGVEYPRAEAVNFYLKSPAEMDLDFSRELAVHPEAVGVRTSAQSHNDIYITVETQTGFLEENY